MIGIDKLGPVLGAEISGVDLSAPLSNSDEVAILQAFLDHKLLIFRDQDVPPAALVKFAGRFGSFDVHPTAPTLGGELSAVQIIDMERSATRPSAYTTELWHSDVTFTPTPYKGAVLKAVLLPSAGGDTLWSNLSAAYELLPDKMQRFVDELEAVHAWPIDYGLKLEGPRALEMYKGATHPVVRVHPETGRKSLFVNELFTRSIVGMRPDESRSLLTLLLQSIKTPETQVRLRWRAGTIVVWDNRCTAHYAVSDYTGRRIMHRVTLAGERPIAAREQPR